MRRFGCFAVLLFWVLLVPATATAQGAIELEQGVMKQAGGFLILATTIHSSKEPPDARIDVHTENGSDGGFVAEGGFNILRFGDDRYVVYLDKVEKGVGHIPDSATIRLVKKDPKLSWDAWIASLTKPAN